MHGILEPLAMGVILLILATGRRRLALVLVALGLSVALGGAINMIQSIPAFGTLASLQTNRLLFSRLTFFNVGLFGEMLAMAAPLLLGAIAARRQLGLGRLAVAVLTIALVVSAAALFLTFSKSAYLATAGGIVTFFLLLTTTWRRPTRRARFRGVIGVRGSVAGPRVAGFSDARYRLQHGHDQDGRGEPILLVGSVDALRARLAGGASSGDRSGGRYGRQPSDPRNRSGSVQDPVRGHLQDPAGAS